MDFTTQKKIASKALYATVGAPVVATRKLRELGTKVTGYSTKMTENAQQQFDEFADEGEKFATDVRSRNYVEEIQDRVDIENLQERVEKLRDQLESTLTNWRDSFAPQDEQKAPVAKTPAKTTAAKKAPAKKTPAKTTAAKKAPAKKTPAKTTAAKKAPAKKAPAKTTARSTSAAKATAAKK